MKGSKKNWNRFIIKFLVVVSVLIFPILGVHYRPDPDFDYTTANALEAKYGVTSVTFEFLGGFNYEEEEKIPENVKQLNGKKIQIVGYMLPIDFDMEGVVKSFMLLNNQMGCCFGVLPRVNDFVYVEMAEGKTVKYMTDVPLKVIGNLEVGKDNLVGGLYTMEGEKVQKVKDY